VPGVDEVNGRLATTVTIGEVASAMRLPPVADFSLVAKVYEVEVDGAVAPEKVMVRVALAASVTPVTRTTLLATATVFDPEPPDATVFPVVGAVPPPLTQVAAVRVTSPPVSALEAVYVKVIVFPDDEAVTTVGDTPIVPVPSIERVTDPFVPCPPVADPPALPVLPLRLVALPVVLAKLEPPPPPPAGL
jgi:hypothetical protein